MARKDKNSCSNKPIRGEYKPTWDDAKPGAVFKSFHSSNNSLSSKLFCWEVHHFYSPSACLTTGRAATALLGLMKPTETSRWVYSLFANSCKVRKVAWETSASRELPGVHSTKTRGFNSYRRKNFSLPKTALSLNVFFKIGCPLQN